MIRTDGKWKCEFIPVSSDCAADTQTQISNSSKELQLSRDVSLLVTILHTNLAVSLGSTGWFEYLIFCTITFSSHLFCSLVSLHYFCQPAVNNLFWCNAKTQKRFLIWDKWIRLQMIVDFLSVCVYVCLQQTFNYRPETVTVKLSKNRGHKDSFHHMSRGPQVATVVQWEPDLFLFKMCNFINCTFA